ncbi:MAG TPA: DUF2252 domain-containing protein [Terriglobia bacterium]|nr:DUF2252 domain-containing protein [Terriglobia bacterium]
MNIGAQTAKIKTAHERMEHGKSRRDAISRAKVGDLCPQERKFDPIEVLLASGEGRIPSLLPVKYARMSASPFAFFRGAVSIMAADLARLPNTGLHVQLCGDAHVQNMGSFAALDGRLVFDLNDFDETIRGPWEWDVKRMATSLVLAGREARQKRSSRREAVELFAESYCQWMAEFARAPIVQVARHIIHRGAGCEPVNAAVRESERFTPLAILKRLTEPGRGGRRHFRNQPPVLRRVTGKEAGEVLAALGAYRDNLASERRHLFDLFRPIDVGFKVVGTGSVGLRDYVVLFEGNGSKDPMFLQIKQEVKSAYASSLAEQVQKHEGRRVVDGQQAIQAVSDLLLGWTAFGGHEYLVRQLNDHKGSIDLETLRNDGLASLAMVAGELLARGHARSGDACAIYGYCGEGSKVTKAILNFAVEYSDQTEADYAKFMAAVRSGKVKVAKGPV